VASTINTLAGALYKVFCASPDRARKEMRQACFDYLSLGGVFSTGPVSLLSGLNPRPLSLVLHFFRCCGLWCWPFIGALSFAYTHLDWSQINFGQYELHDETEYDAFLLSSENLSFLRCRVHQESSSPLSRQKELGRCSSL